MSNTNATEMNDRYFLVKECNANIDYTGHVLKYAGPSGHVEGDLVLWQPNGRGTLSISPDKVQELVFRTPSPEEQGKFASVSWAAGDVQSLFSVTEEQALEFLDNNAKHIQDRLTELGWGVLETLGVMDGLPLTQAEDFE